MPARFDQHFLADMSIADQVVIGASITRGEQIVEIGPGRGVLTERMLAAGAKVTAVELDRRLIEPLEKKFAGKDFNVIQGDFMKLDLAKLPRDVGIVSNLPYSVGTAILQRLLDWPHWSRMVLMFQKEVAQRIIADPGSKAYGILALSAQIKSSANEVCEAPAAAFSPPPKVDSMVLRFEPLATPRLPIDVAERRFFTVVKAAFAQKRKMAAKALAANLGLPRADVDAAFVDAGLETTLRAERISLEGFIQLTRKLSARLAQ
jgi:16S rRNA (adenine1518-N6/adenine1519-N6)-dimethyltransferase